MLLNKELSLSKLNALNKFTVKKGLLLLRTWFYRYEISQQNTDIQISQQNATKESNQMEEIGNGRLDVLLYDWSVF